MKRILIGLSTTHPEDAVEIAKMMLGHVDIHRYDDAIMEWTQQATGLTPNLTEDPKIMDSYLPEQWSYIRNERFVNGGDVTIQPVKYHTTPRQILERIRFMGREIHSQFWVNLMFARWPESYDDKPWLIPDVTYPNEADGIIENEGVLWRIERRGPGSRKNDFLVKYPHVHRRFTVNGPLTQVVEELKKAVSYVEEQR